MIPYGRQWIDEDDIDAVVAALKSDFLTTGPKIPEFEQAFSKITGAAETVVCANGTAALHLAALAAGLGPGDAAIVPSVTFLATANGPHYTGAEIIFADVDPQTGLMRPQDLEEALSCAGKLTPKAVFPVDLAGRCADLPALSRIAKQHGLSVVADSCHSVGGTYVSRNGELVPVGSCADADMTTFSFHPVKTLTMGEGGAITTNNRAFAERMRTARHHGMVARPDLGPWCYDMPDVGYNYRATDLQCALGLSQLAKLEMFVRRRRELAALYDALLADLSPVIRTPVPVSKGEAAWHLYAVRIDFEALGISREDLVAGLRGYGVGTQVHYIPVHSQPYYAQRYGTIELPGAEAYYRHTLSLPLYPAMTEQDVQKVVQAIRQITGVTNYVHKAENG